MGRVEERYERGFNRKLFPEALMLAFSILLTLAVLLGTLINLKPENGHNFFSARIFTHKIVTFKTHIKNNIILGKSDTV